MKFYTWRWNPYGSVKLIYQVIEVGEAQLHEPPTSRV